MAEKIGFSLRVLSRADQGGRARTRSSLQRPEHASQETGPCRLYTQVHSGCLHQHAPKSLCCIILRFNTASSLSREKCLSPENAPDGHPQPLVHTFHISLFTAQLSSPSRPPHPDLVSLSRTSHSSSHNADSSLFRFSPLTCLSPIAKVVLSVVQRKSLPLLRTRFPALSPVSRCPLP